MELNSAAERERETDMVNSQGIYLRINGALREMSAGTAAHPALCSQWTNCLWDQETDNAEVLS